MGRITRTVSPGCLNLPTNNRPKKGQATGRGSRLFLIKVNPGCLTPAIGGVACACRGYARPMRANNWPMMCTRCRGQATGRGVGRMTGTIAPGCLTLPARNRPQKGQAAGKGGRLFPIKVNPGCLTPTIGGVACACRGYARPMRANNWPMMCTRCRGQATGTGVGRMTGTMIPGCLTLSTHNRPQKGKVRQPGEEAVCFSLRSIPVA